MRIQTLFASLSALSFTVVACGSGDVSLGNNEYAIQKTSTGGATGNGQTCAWTGVAGTGSASSGPDTPVSSDATQYNVGDDVRSPDACNSCRCTAQGIACTTKVCPGCDYNKVKRAIGSSFPSADGCNTCTCSSEGVACTEKACAPKTCKVGNKEYQAGESFSDGCNGCVCDQNGLVACTAKACATCTYNNQEYQVGESYPAADGCNACTCEASGTSVCTAKDCQ